MLLFAYSVFGVGCLCCGLARNIDELIAARVSYSRDEDVDAMMGDQLNSFSIGFCRDRWRGNDYDRLNFDE